MQQYIKQFGLACVLGVSTLMAGAQQHDQLGADIRQLVVQLTGVCNQKCSASSRENIREILTEGRQAILYQLSLFERGMSLEQMQADEQVIQFRDTFGYRVQPLQEEIVADLQHKDELVDAVMMVKDIVDPFFEARQEEITKLLFDTSLVKKQIEYWLLAIDTALEHLQ